MRLSSIAPICPTKKPPKGLSGREHQPDNSRGHSYCRGFAKTQARLRRFLRALRDKGADLMTPTVWAVVVKVSVAGVKVPELTVTVIVPGVVVDWIGMYTRPL